MPGYNIKGSVNVGKNLTADRVIADTANQFAEWTPLTDYLAGDVVIENNKFYKRIADGTSGATFDNTEEALWDTVGGGDEVSPTAWATATDYILGATVSNEGRIYRASVAHTSTTFNADRANWVVVTELPLGDWLASTYYYAGEEVTATGDVWVRTSSGTSGLTFDATEQLNWSAKVYGVDIVAWAPTTLYTANQLVTQNGRILQRLTTGTSGATFNGTEAANWTIIQINAAVSTFAGSTYYYAGEQVSTVGKVVQRITSGTSAGTFSNAEAANWTLVSYDLSVWTPTTYFYTNQRCLAPTTRALIVGAGGFTSTTFDATEVTNGSWQLTNNNGSVTPYASGIYFFIGDLMSNSGATYRRTIAGDSGATLDATELLNWELVTGNPITSISGAYTVTETDDLIMYSGGGYTITIPAGRVNKVIKFATTSLNATPPTIAVSGAETITNPSTYVLVTSFTAPGTTGLASSVQFQFDGSNWNYVA